MKGRGDLYENEKIVHSPKMVEYLLEHGGKLLKTKRDLKDVTRKIYIFDAKSIDGIIGNYRRGGYCK